MRNFCTIVEKSATAVSMGMATAPDVGVATAVETDRAVAGGLVRATTPDVATSVVGVVIITALVGEVPMAAVTDGKAPKAVEMGDF